MYLSCRRSLSLTLVLHGAPTKYAPGQMRTWIETDGMESVPIAGIHWLLKKYRRAGKQASSLSLVIYLKNSIGVNQGVGGSSAQHDITGRDREDVSTRACTVEGVWRSFSLSDYRVHLSLLAWGARLTWPVLESVPSLVAAYHKPLRLVRDCLRLTCT